MDDSTAEAEFARYARQWRYAPLGLAGQKALSRSRALICGCGALGTTAAGLLARAGVGHLRIVDRDFVELTNLQRQTLFDEDDVERALPKAIAAAEKLARVNSAIAIEPIVADIDAGNIRALVAGVDCIVDGSDNFELRFLVNDTAHATNIPWVYAGCLGAEGQSMTILPGETPCLRCLMPEPPPPGSAPTCDSAGVLGPAVSLIASLEAAEALKILSGNHAAVSRQLTVIDVWDNRLRQVALDGLLAQRCATCERGEYPWLSGERASGAAVLCGRNAVQLSPPGAEPLMLDSLADKLAPLGAVTRNRYLLRAKIGAYELTIFPDGRAIIGGTSDVAAARGVYARYIGN